jgi:SAM-dependent methyltransferase/DNA-binding MarR family transcriptional regulator
MGGFMVTNGLIFKAMADTTRQRLLCVLSKHELSVSELVEVLDQPQSTISRHLKVLRAAGLLIDRRLGATVRYAVRQALSPLGRSPVVAGKPQNVDRADDLRAQLLGWVEREPLGPVLDERLAAVIRRRHADTTGFFESIGARWDELRVDAFGEVFHLEALNLLLPPDWTVADIGTGTGYLLPALSGLCRQVIAVEPAGRMLEAARNRPELKSARNIVFREGALAELPIEDGELDLAIASLVLHHVEEPRAALREIRRCLRAGGHLLIIEQQEHEYAGFRDRMGDHWWGFPPETLEGWLTEAGFGDVRSRRLSAARPRNRGAADVPGLFAVTARKP